MVAAPPGKAGAPVPAGPRMQYDEHDRYELRRCVALSLANRPYSASYMIMEFVPNPLADANDKYMQIPSQLLYDRVDAAIACNENASDWALHDFIVTSNGQIVEILKKKLEEMSSK